MPARPSLSRAARRAARCVAAWAALQPAAALAVTGGLEEIVVTATRRAELALETPLSLSSIDRDALQLLGATHHSEALNRLPGVMSQRGSGQESLTAIRSPVLTGAGSCGAFLFLENGVPIRPAGFCNVNELFEVNTEQALSIEVLRGPATSLYGSSAMHGTVNVLQAAPAQSPGRAASLDVGPDAYYRGKFAGALDTDGWDYRLAGLYTHDSGWRIDAGFDEAKLVGAAVGNWGDMPSRVDLSATWLDQNTEGFITGRGAYKSEYLSRQNANPEAYREASTLRVTSLLEPSIVGSARLELRPYLRTSRMEFLQHFLLGKPLENNGQESAGVMSSLSWEADPDWRALLGLDLELADSFLREDQEGPTTGGTPPANAIRPAGLHYDYGVRSWMAALYGHGERRFADRWRVIAGARLESVNYDYDNRMLAGNTDENGVPCGPSGCLYSRPADRTDSFLVFAPKLALALDLRDGLMAYANAMAGFRPPEMTELYRLQRAQRVADLDPEQAESVELGLKGASDRIDFTLALFDMRKHNVILRESNGFNVDNGRTTHRGVEGEFRWRPFEPLAVVGAGTYARHQYDFSRRVEGGEQIVKGNDIDTAPRQVYRTALDWQPSPAWAVETEWLVVGKYWLDAANEHFYNGHGLLNLRGRWQPDRHWALTLRLDNALDRRYADRADYAFGTYRYFPGRGRALFAEIAWARD